jgi:hypothetical protein
VRIPYPERISLWHALSFAAVLSGVQLFEGTAPLFTLCSFLFIIIATIAFNVAGGLTRPSGAYVFFYALLAVIVGLCWKAILGEPADSHLLAPLLTMQVFLGGITAMLGAVFVSRRLTSKRALLGNLVTNENIQNATVGCMVTGLVVTFILLFSQGQSGQAQSGGSVLSALSQLNRFLPMAIILGVIYQIRKSGGTSSVNIPVLVSGVAIFILGLIGFSKEGLFTPFLCWAVAAGSMRYRLNLYQIIGGIFVVFFMQQFLVPYAQYGRNFRSETGSITDNVDTAINLLSNLEETRQRAEQSIHDAYEAKAQGYYNTPQGLLDRFQMLSADDMLIDGTERHGNFGYSPIVMGFANLVPRVFWPNKPSINFGNLYAHELGGLAEDDFTTGISFSPSGEGYHIDRWMGIFLLAPILWILLFTLYDSLCGTVRDSPWGLLAIALFSHAAPEGMLGGIIYMLGFSALSIAVAALSAAYVMPMLGMLVKGPGQVSIGRSVPVHTIPRTVSTVRRWHSTGRDSA